MTSVADYIASAVTNGLTFKSNRLFARRTIPGSAGLQAKELSWRVKEYDGSRFGAQPDQLSQAEGLVARGKAVRDLQALLTNSVAAGAQAADILRAFNLVCWILPIVEIQSSVTGNAAQQSGVSHMICNKASGHPLEGFSGCSAGMVWAGLHHGLHLAVTRWLKGQYSRVKTGRSNEYQLARSAIESESFKQQQMSAFSPHLHQLQVVFDLLDKHSQQDLPAVQPQSGQMVDPANFSHLKLTDHVSDVALRLCEKFIMNPEALPVQLPVRSKQMTSLDLTMEHHVIRCHIHGPGVGFQRMAEQGFLSIQEKLDMTQHQLIKNEDDVFNKMWLEGHAGSLLLDLTLATAFFPTMAELLIAAKALWLALQQALPQEQYFPGVVGYTILLNDHLAMVKESELASTRLQHVPKGSVPLITFAEAVEDVIEIQGENLLSSTEYSAVLPGNFSSFPLRIVRRQDQPSAGTVCLTFPESLRSITGADVQVEACNGHYKSVQKPVIHSRGAAGSPPTQLQAMQLQPQALMLARQTLHNARSPSVQLMDATESTWQSSGSLAIPSKLSSQQYVSGRDDIGQGKALPGRNQDSLPDDQQSNVVNCASCQQLVLQGNALHKLPALEKYGWFCDKCQQQATLRGAILLVLSKFRRKGATFADLNTRIEGYRRSCVRAGGEHGLLGGAISVKSQLTWMVDGQDVKGMDLPALVERIPHENRRCILYRLVDKPGAASGQQSMEQGVKCMAATDSSEASGDNSGAVSHQTSGAASDADSDANSSGTVEAQAYQAKLDRLKCSNCNATGREDTFLLCDSCSHGYHAECVGQELPSTRFWWCPDCTKRGLTIKGLIIQVLEEAGEEGLTSAEINNRVIDRRPRGCPPHSVRGERSRLVNGVSGKMANGRPLLVCFGEPPGMYKLAPDPDFSAPETVSSHAMATTGYTQDPQPAHVSQNVTAATGPVAQSFLGSNIGTSAAVTTAAAEQLSRVRAQHAPAAVSGSTAVSVALPAGTASSLAATAAGSIHGIAPSVRAFPPGTVSGVFGSGQKVNAPEAPFNMSARLAPGWGAARPDALRQEKPMTAPHARPGSLQAPKLASVRFQDPADPLPPVLVAALRQIDAGKAAEARPASLQAQQSSRTDGVRKAMSEHERVRPGTQLGTCPRPSAAGARSCTVCHEVDARELYCCGSCEALLHEDCTTRLPEPLDSYCLFCLDCQREPWHQGAIILAGGKAGAEGMTTNELRCAVKECRQRCVEQRAAAGTAGPKTYDGLRGDSVSFSDQFARMTSKRHGFHFQQVPESASLTGSQIRWRLGMEWGTCTEQASSAQMVCNVPASTKAAGKEPVVTSPLFTIASPAIASSMATRQHDTQSPEADVVLEQVTAHQASADQAELGASPQAGGSDQQAGTSSGTRRNNRQQSSGKRSRHRFRVDSDSDEEPAEPKKLCHSRRMEIVAPFSLRSSRKGPDDAEQGVTVHELGYVYTGPGLQLFGYAVNNTYHCQYPVGYKAVMQVQDRSKRCQEWTLEVQLEDDAPRFQVSNKMGYTYVASVKATEDNMKMGLRGVLDFGFGNAVVLRAIEQMYGTVEMPKSQRDDCDEQPLKAAVAHTAPVSQHSASVSQHSAARSLHNAPMSHVVKPANMMAQPHLSIGPMMTFPSVMGLAPRPGTESSRSQHAEEEQGTVGRPNGRHQQHATLGDNQPVGFVTGQDDQVTGSGVNGSGETEQKQNVDRSAHAAGLSSEVIPVEHQVAAASSLPAQIASEQPRANKDCAELHQSGEAGRVLQRLDVQYEHAQ
ncbi:TPA: PHD and RING finger domain-containing protein 1 [Trebouxia sp. C0004]